MGEKRDRKVLGKEGSGRHGARVVRVLGVWDGRGFGVDDCELSDLLRKRMEVDWGWSEFGTRVQGTELLPWEEQRSCRLWEWALAESSGHYKELWPCSVCTQDAGLGAGGGHTHGPLHPNPHIAFTDMVRASSGSGPSLQVRIVPFKRSGFHSHIRAALTPRPFRLICSRPLHPCFIFSEPLKNRQKQVNSP